MRNELFSIGPFTVYGYGVMLAVAILSAGVSATYRAKKLNLNADIIIDITLWCALGGIVGAKLLYVITMFNAILQNPRILLNVTEGFVVYGGIIGGILTGYVFARRKKLDFLKYFDLIMPSIALAQGFGRIGCIFAGCCYGIATDASKLHIIFNQSAHAPNGIPLVPTQTISSILNFLHFFILIFYARNKKNDGQVAALYLTLYSAGRFILEFFRGDLGRGQVGHYSTSQFISIIMFVAGVVLFVALQRRKPVEEINKEAETEGEEHEYD